MLYLLSRHPEVTEKLRSEIIAAVPEGPPTFDDVRNLKYRESLLMLPNTEDRTHLPGTRAVRACLNETLRLFPPVVSNSRASVRQTLIPGPPGSKPIYVASGTTVSYSDMLMQRWKDLWGEDALEFDPKRWIDAERVKIMTSDPFKFVPFNAGPRICLGQVS